MFRNSQNFSEVHNVENNEGKQISKMADRYYRKSQYYCSDLLSGNTNWPNDPNFFFNLSLKIPHQKID